MRPTCALIAACFISLVASSLAAQSGYFNLPISSVNYPPIARAARLEGIVTVSLEFGSDGAVSHATVVSGPAMLQSAVLEIVKTWHLGSTTHTSGIQVARFDFRLTAPPDDYGLDSPNPPDLRIADDGTIVISSYAYPQDGRTECPVPDRQNPPREQVAGDFVETGWPLLHIEASGKVLWNPPGDFSHPDWQRATTELIAPESARGLIETFRTAIFWKFCRSYDNGATDTETRLLHVQLGGVERSVMVHGDVAPPAFENLLDSIHSVTNSHQWRVGDPKTEVMGDMHSDIWLPKPGRTTLMKNAYHGETEKVRRALEAGADLNEHDDSGWTPLMYAVAGYGTEDVVKLLLEHHASVNAKGLHGDTALMFAALDGEVDEQLIAAGADVNAQMTTGTTAFMLLAQSGSTETLSKLLAAHADGSVQDREGRTAGDYLQADECGRPIVVRDTQPWMTIGYAACGGNHPEARDDVKALLRRVGAAPRKTWTAAGALWDADHIYFP